MSEYSNDIPNAASEKAESTKTGLESKSGDRQIYNIHLVGGEKGGVGKTFIARCLCQYMSLQEQAYALVEADSQINDVGRIYSDQAETAEVIRLSDDPSLRSQPDLIADLAEKNTVVVNLPSNTLDVLENWMKEVSFLGFLGEREGGQLYKWFVSDGCHESILQLKRSVEQFDNQIPHILVLNKGRLNGRDFHYLKDSQIYNEVREAPNLVAEIEFPALETGVQYFIDSHELTLQQAKEDAEGHLGIMAKQRVKTFIDVFSSQFDGVLKLKQGTDHQSSGQQVRRSRQSDERRVPDEDSSTSSPKK